MNILWLNANLLLPLDKGGKLRTWHLMRHLARRHDITYLSFHDPDGTDQGSRDGMREVCRRLETVPRRDPAKGTARFYADAARFVFDRVPYGVAKYRSRSYRELLGRLLDEERFDAVVCDFLVPLVNMPERLPCPSILFTHNVEAEIWRRHAATAAGVVSRKLLRDQWRRMLRFEGQALGRFDLVLAVSDTDRQTFQQLYPASLRAPVHVVQTGVDTAYFAPVPPERTAGGRAAPHLVFTGSMDWLPNEDGMVYFVREILPHIRTLAPGTTLSIIGRSPTPAVRRLAEVAGVEVTGRVDDVRPHIAAGDIYVVPLRIGGGTRLKIFEAMSMGKAVVSTAIGAEGLPVSNGENIVIANDPGRFAEAVVGLIRDAETRQRIERAARQLVVEHYDWATVADDFELALGRLCVVERTDEAASPAGRPSSAQDRREASRLAGSI